MGPKQAFFCRWEVFSNAKPNLTQPVASGIRFAFLHGIQAWELASLGAKDGHIIKSFGGWGGQCLRDCIWDLKPTPQLVKSGQHCGLQVPGNHPKRVSEPTLVAELGTQFPFFWAVLSLFPPPTSVPTMTCLLFICGIDVIPFVLLCLKMHCMCANNSTPHPLSSVAGKAKEHKNWRTYTTH